jgi:hypothetical protein
MKKCSKTVPGDRTNLVCKIKILLASVLLSGAIFIYILLRGTEKLFVVTKINSIAPLIPVFEGIKCSCRFITGYLVDILWYTSFCIISSLHENWHGFFEAFFIATILEFMQRKFKILGTFDVIDILIYFLITLLFFFIFLYKQKNKFHNIL